MKNYDEYMKNIHGKAEKMRARRRRFVTSCIASVLALAVIAGVLLSGVFARPDPEQGTNLYHPTTGANAPTTGANAPTQGDSGTTDAPTTGVNAPTTGVNAPTTGANAPTTGANAPTTGANAPTQGDSGTTDAPTTGVNAPTTGVNAPTTGANAPTTGANAPTTGANAPTTGANAPTTGSNAPTTGANAPTTGEDAPTAPQDPSDDRVVLADGYLQHTTERGDYSWLLEHLNAPIYDVDYDETAPDVAPGDSGASGATEESESYVEVTDNQVAGIIEGDLFKRSDKYLYYLYADTLRVYSVAGEDSALVGEIDLTQQLAGNRYTTKREMYLSADCKTVTILATNYADRRLVLLSLDVSEPTNVSVAARKEFSGESFSSRMVENTLLLSYYYSIYDLDALVTPDEPTRYVPSYGSDGDMQPMDACNIYCPSDVVTNSYAVFAKVDLTTLEVKDMVALVGYQSLIYVSEDRIYATRSCLDRTSDENDGYTAVGQTAVTGIGYADDGLQLDGTIVLNGYVLNQYWMDEYEGVLRVAATTRVTKRYRDTEGLYHYDFERNCSLYCVDLSDWTICASVIDFAPSGDEVVSARFEGVNAYICTAEVAKYTDPVYFFDLSDLQDIRYKHTPIIDGYSSSLIRFGDYLVGIGIDSDRTMKIEVYVETDDGVESIGEYLRNANASTDYKCYYIDRENGILGIPVVDYEDWTSHYLLLQLDGESLQLLHEIDVEANATSNLIRATVIDGYLYILEKTLHVVPVN